jgi:hypothetical protein
MVSNSAFEIHYQELINKKREIDFLFIGQDPYPDGANGVAFCKNTYQEFFQDSCCGLSVMLSLGYPRVDIYKNYDNPKKLFIDLLLEKGIAFANVSNELMRKLSESELEKAILQTKTKNSKALDKAKKIILLGRGKTRNYFEKFYSEYKYDYVLLHPSKNAKNSNEREWNSIWTTNYIEKEIINKTDTKTNTGVKVIGRIDLSKFEKPKKEISKDKENIYIIDTNVFVDCPDIISKINKQYKIVLSAKVIDELDNLKSSIKLSEQQNKNVQTALRKINESIDRRKIKMDTADLKLLPNDFSKRSPDNFILSVALKYKNENPIMLTSDNGLQIKSKGLNLTTIKLKDFLKQK